MWHSKHMCTYTLPNQFSNTLISWCLFSVSVLCFSTWCVCSVSVLCFSTWCLCSVSVLCFSTWCMCSVSVLCFSTWCVCSVSVLCFSTWCVCSVSVLCFSTWCFQFQFCVFSRDGELRAHALCPDDQQSVRPDSVSVSKYYLLSSVRLVGCESQRLDSSPSRVANELRLDSDSG